jgi:hypothetical protein
MQRAAQDWQVLTQLTHNNATAVGIVMALQFAALLLLLPVTGFAADHLDRRFLLIGTQVRAGPRPVISHSSDEGLFLYYPRRASAAPEVFLALEEEINGRRRQPIRC